MILILLFIWIMIFDRKSFMNVRIIQAMLAATIVNLHELRVMSRVH